ncbi:methylated-DNA--[protein]-cysteine S-methyltransferase [Advenella sp. RU8]|uniref:methylated-DNA--[protein]-cysteine S-methyltransferase n=1 Tax=Advenella sp. RU8 TaxID=3399575 RepID=UPI003AAA5E0D
MVSQFVQNLLFGQAMIKLYMSRMNSPLGEIILMTDDRQNLRVLDFADYDERMHDLLQRQYGQTQIISADTPCPYEKNLQDYFNGHLAALDNIPVATGGTKFQRTVWQALQKIPYGQTMSYGELAAKVGNPKASRAVGLANGANPISIVIPCHRVIGKNGSMTGYGGGLERKLWLLHHESQQPALIP